MVNLLMLTLTLTVKEEKEEFSIYGNRMDSNQLTINQPQETTICSFLCFVETDTQINFY